MFFVLRIKCINFFEGLYFSRKLNIKNFKDKNKIKTSVTNDLQSAPRARQSSCLVNLRMPLQEQRVACAMPMGEGNGMNCPKVMPIAHALGGLLSTGTKLLETGTSIGDQKSGDWGPEVGGMGTRIRVTGGRLISGSTIIV